MRLLALFVFALASANASTPTFGAISASGASPNSALVTVTITGGVSEQIQASTDTSYGIKTPWFPVAASGIAAQLHPSTAYNFRVVACDQAVTAFGSCGGNQGTSAAGTASTNAPIVSYPLTITQGPVVGYNATQFPLNGRSMDGDTTYCTQLTNLSIVCQHNDAQGPQRILVQGGSYTGGRNAFLSTVDAGFTNFQLLNPLGTGDGTNGYGGVTQNNIPTCWSDGQNVKSHSIYADVNTLYWAPYRQDTNDSQLTIIRSDDGGATLYRPDHNAGQASANGDPPCPGAGIMWPTAWQLRFIKTGNPGNVVTNPVDGLDAYHYAQLLKDLTHIGLVRFYRKLNLQDVTNAEYWIGSVGGDTNDSANWGTVYADMTNHYTAPAGVFDEEIQYLPDFGRFALTAYTIETSTDFRTTILDSPHVSGLYQPRYLEATQPSPNVYRAWLSIFFPNYVLTQSNPPAATVGILHSGQFTQHTPADPANNFYSPWLLPVTISFTATASAAAGGKAALSGNASIQ